MAESTDTSERGLERLICTALTGHPCDPPREHRVAEARPAYGGVGWSGGDVHDYDRELGVALFRRVLSRSFIRVYARRRFLSGAF